MAVDQHFVVEAEHSDWSWRIGDGNLLMFTHTDSTEPYSTGEFRDPRGIASIYRQSDLTRIDFAFQGRCYSRSWRKYFGNRTISRLARAFITELVGEPA